MARVLWRDAQGKEGTVVLSRQEVRIGRAADCEICTEDGMVSRYHARIIRKGPAYLVEDLGSANGIFFEERQVKQHHLTHGDAVRCGSLWIRFIDAPEASRDEPARPAAARGVRGTMVLQQPPAAASNAVGQPEETMPPQASAGADAAPSPVGAVAARAPSMAPPDEEAENEIRLLRRRVEQLQHELRTIRGSKDGPDHAKRIEDLESDLFAMTADRDRLHEGITALQSKFAAQSKDQELGQARWVINTAVDASEQLQDVLASLRVELIAAADEFEQYAAQLPRASFELIRQSMRDASRYAEQSRELVRTLASLQDAAQP